MTKPKKPCKECQIRPELQFPPHEPDQHYFVDFGKGTEFHLVTSRKLTSDEIEEINNKPGWFSTLEAFVLNLPPDVRPIAMQKGLLPVKRGQPTQMA